MDKPVTAARKERAIVMLTEHEKTVILPYMMGKMHRRSESDVLSALLLEAYDRIQETATAQVA